MPPLNLWIIRQASNSDETNTFSCLGPRLLADLLVSCCVKRPTNNLPLSPKCAFLVCQLTERQCHETAMEDMIAAGYIMSFQLQGLVCSLVLSSLVGCPEVLRGVVQGLDRVPGLD